MKCSKRLSNAEFRAPLPDGSIMLNYASKSVCNLDGLIHGYVHVVCNLDGLIHGYVHVAKHVFFMLV